MPSRKRTRSYDASGRQQRALENQEKMLEAARRLFSTRGYQETRVEDIAAEAGVAAPTVYASFQSKRGILHALMKRLTSGVPGGPPLLDTSGPRQVNAEPDPRRALKLFVEHLMGVQERAIPIYEVMKHAARVDPEIADLLAGMQQHRFSNLSTLARRFGQLGALRAGLSVDDASHTLWAIASPEVRQLLLGAGWPIDRYRDWLEDTLAAALFATRRR